MNGKSLFLDTNAIIHLLNGSSNIQLLLEDALTISISIISKIEFLSYNELSDQDIDTFNDFINLVNVVNLENSNTDLIEKITSIRNNYKLKLPDAIIAASAQLSSATLVTADKDFKRIKGLELNIIE